MDYADYKSNYDEYGKGLIRLNKLYGLIYSYKNNIFVTEPDGYIYCKNGIFLQKAANNLKCQNIKAQKEIIAYHLDGEPKEIEPTLLKIIGRSNTHIGYCWVNEKIIPVKHNEFFRLCCVREGEDVGQIGYLLNSKLRKVANVFIKRDNSAIVGIVPKILSGQKKTRAIEFLKEKINKEQEKLAKDSICLANL